MIWGHTIATSITFGTAAGSDSACSFGIDCLVPQALDPSVSGVAILLLFVVVASSYLSDAIEVVDTEIERTVDERTALEVFADRVATLQVGDPTTQTGPPDRFRIVTDGGTGERVIDAYRETVMAVPHFDCEYDESLEENMAAELGRDVTVALLDSDQLSPPLQQALVTKADRAAELRGELVELLEAERNQLVSAEETLDAIASDYRAMKPIEEFAADPEVTDECLTRLEERCEAVVQSRQDEIHDNPMNRRVATREKEPNLQEYLYSSMPVTYPVLSFATDLLEDIRTTRRAIA